MVKFETPARLKLLRLNMGASEIARHIGKVRHGPPPAPGMVSRWLLGDARPNEFNKPILAKLWNIPANDWLTAAERRQAKTFGKRAAANSKAV